MSLEHIVLLRTTVTESPYEVCHTNFKTSIQSAIDRVLDVGSSADWFAVYHDSDSFAPEGHPAKLAAPNHMPPLNPAVTQDEDEGCNWVNALLVHSGAPLGQILAELPADIGAVGMPVFWVDNDEGSIARGVTRECRIIRRGVEARITPFGFFAPKTAWLTKHAMVRYPLAAQAYARGDMSTAVRYGANTKNKIERRVFIKARAELEAREAEDAFRDLFRHMSLSEELWRLREMMKYLPFTIEDRVDDLRVLLQKQIGHLETPEGELAWYRDGSPAEIINATYAAFTSPGNPTHRVQWMMAEAKKRGFKRVVELGSVDGVNLFAYEALAPEIQWHGVEANPKGKAHADAICAELKRKPLNMHTNSFEGFAGSVWGGSGEEPFDAAAVFEVLEHNFDPTPVLDAAEMCVKPGGRVYITTPNGNWSAHDEGTRVVDLRKDHVNAYTVKRMRKMLEARGAKDIECFEVDNPSYDEANSWCYSSYRVD